MTDDDTERQVRRLSRQWWAISIACIGLWLTAGAVWVAAGNWPAALSDLAFACFTAFYLWSLRNAENENAELRNRLENAANTVAEVLEILVERSATDMAGTNGQDDTLRLPSERFQRIALDDPDSEP